MANSESFKYKRSIITGKTAVNRGTKKVEFTVPLTHFSNF